MEYLGGKFEGSFEIDSQNIQQHNSFVMRAASNPAETRQDHLELSIMCQLHGQLEVAIYCQYWLINQTGRDLEIQPLDVLKKFTIWPTHGKQQAVMFGFKTKKEAKVTLRCGRSSVSDPFSLNTAGSAGQLACKLGEHKMEFGVKVVMSHFNLTKLVYFTPYNLFVNHTKLPLAFTDATGRRTEVLPESTEGFFPETKVGLVRVRLPGEKEDLKPVNYHRSGMSLLLSNRGKVVCATVEVSNAVTTITIDEYFSGSCPVLIQNHCDRAKIKIWQKDTKKVIEIGPHQEHHFTWEKPGVEKRELTWQFHGTKIEKTDDMMENDRNVVKAPKGVEIDGGEKDIQWVSFMDGLQRVLLFTPSKDVADVAYKNDLVERANQEISLSLHGVSLSLVNDANSREVAFIGLTSSTMPIWQVERKKGKWKTLKMEDCLKAEQGERAGKMMKDKDFEVVGQAGNWVMKKPMEGKLRRTFHPAILVKLSLSAHQTKVHTAINKVQIDNQIPAAVFPGVLFTLPPPETVALQQAPKPFLEFSLFLNKMEDSRSMQIKYLMLLIQELHVQADIAFVMSLLGLFSSEVDANRMALQHSKTMEMVTSDLATTAAVQALKNDARMFFDYLHLSPLKVHVSFSLQEADKVLLGAQDFYAQLIISLLHSVGVTLSEASDIQLKMAYFEMDSEMLTQSQLISQIVHHYVTQAVNQFYVLVLGLDVLGNPFGLVRGVKDGFVDLFYEPYQGAIQGPEELAQGLLIGGRNFFGATVGGVFGAVSRITGTLGKGVARLTLDDKYIEERRRAQAQPTDAASGIAMGVKGLGKGLFSGITGVITKPVEGAKSEGGVGFVKGLGRGLIGVVARPVGGVIDLASNTFEGIKKTVEVSEGEWHRLRARRYLAENSAVLPYSTSRSTGMVLMDALKRGSNIDSDLGQFQFSETLRKDPKIVLLVTSRFVMLCKLPFTFLDHDEELKPEWYCLFSDLERVPYVPREGPPMLVINCRASKTSGFGPVDYIKGEREQKLKVDSVSVAEAVARRFEAVMSM